MTTILRAILGPVAALIAYAGYAGPASAHPHVWVSVETTVVYEKGTVSGLQQRWTFDDLYTAMAIEGLDKNGDGTYGREELKELAQVNIDGLKEFEYFTYAKLGTGKIAFAAPRDYWLEHTNGVLTLNFMLPLQQPILAEAPGFNFSVYDPSFFIAFDLAKTDPIKISSGAPNGCTATVGVAAEEAANQERLNQALANELGGGQTAPVVGTKTISVACPHT